MKNELLVKKKCFAPVFAVAAICITVLVAISLYTGWSNIRLHSHQRWRNTLNVVFMLENIRHQTTELYAWQENYIRAETLENRFLAVRKLVTTRQMLEQHMDQCFELVDRSICPKDFSSYFALLETFMREQSRIEALTHGNKTKESVDDELLMLRSLRDLLLSLTASLRENLVSQIRTEDQQAYEQLMINMLAGLCALFLLLILLTINTIKRRKAEIELHNLNLKLEQRVHDRTAEMEESSRELDNFVTSVSYDLRAPLRRIQQYATAINEDFSSTLPRDAAGYIRRINKLSGQSLTMVENLLALSRVTAAKVDRSEIDLGLIAKDIVRDLQQFYRKHSPDVKIGKGLRTDADSTLVRILLFNLLDNAFKFTRNVQNPVIEVGLDESTQPPVFYVRDNGIGYDQKYADKLFNAFSSLHDIKEYPGNGMGLVTAARIVNKHGGSIHAECNSTTGTKFYFSLEALAEPLASPA